MRIIELEEPLTIESLKKALERYAKWFPDTKPCLYIVPELKFLGKEVTHKAKGQEPPIDLPWFVTYTIRRQDLWFIADVAYADIKGTNQYTGTSLVS